jgi:hypothetical protein
MTFAWTTFMISLYIITHSSNSFRFLPVSGSTCGRKGVAVEGVCDLVSISSRKYAEFATIPLSAASILKTSPQFIPYKTRHDSSCAVVGHSESLLKCSSGSEIDASDVVYRIGFVPLTSYAKHAGLKANYTLCRSLSCQMSKRTATGEIRDARGFRMGNEYKSARIVLPHLTKSEQYIKQIRKDLLLWKKSILRSDISAIALDDTESYGLSPTSGFHLGIDLMLSGRCKSLTLYGLGGGLRRYSYKHKPAEDATVKQKKSLLYNMKRNHSPQLEILIVERLRASGMKIASRNC